MTFALWDLNNKNIPGMKWNMLLYARTYKYRDFRNSGSIFPAYSKCIFQTHHSSGGKPITPQSHLKTKLSKRDCIWPRRPVCIRIGRKNELQSPCLCVCTSQNVCQLFSHFSSSSKSCLLYPNFTYNKPQRTPQAYPEGWKDTDGEVHTLDVLRTMVFSDLPRTVRITFASSMLSYKFSHCQLVGLKLQRTDLKKVAETHTSLFILNPISSYLSMTCSIVIFPSR